MPRSYAHDPTARCPHMIYENVTCCHGMTSMASMAEGKCHSSSSGSKASTYITSQM